MKFLRFGASGHEKPGCLDGEGRIRDLSGIVPDITAQAMIDGRLASLKPADVAALPVVESAVRLGTPWAGMGKFLCVGLNYRDHAEETGSQIPAEPVLFTKWSRPGGPNDPIVLPRGSEKTDWEVELGVVIGRKARYVSAEAALEHVAGYCVVNDVSEREYQLHRGGTWDKGKGCDSFGPVGPWLVTPDEIPDPQRLGLWLELNGKRLQDSTTGQMIFGVGHLVHYISQFTTLYPGDLIATGTPAGVGLGQKPPLYLRDGDVVRLGIAGLGEQQQRVHAWDAALLD